MSSPVITAIGCTIASWSSTIEPGLEGWTEHVRLTVHGAEGCEGLTITTDDGSTVSAFSGHVSAAHNDHNLGPERLVLGGVRADGVATWTVITPELHPGDTARLDLDVRSSYVADYLWRPTPGVAYAELRRPRALTLAITGLRNDKRFVFGADPTAGAQVVVQHPWLDRTPPPLPPSVGLSPDDARAKLAGIAVLGDAFFGDRHVVGDALFALGAADVSGWSRTLAALTAGGPAPITLEDAAKVTPASVEALGAAPDVTATLTLRFRSSNPRAELRPDRALMLEETRTLSWADASATRAVFIALPRDAAPPPAAPGPCPIRATTGAAWVIAPPGVASCTLALTTPVVDVWGLLAPELVGHVGASSATWTDHHGLAHADPLVIEGGAWRLPSLGGAPILSDRDRLWHELHQRFEIASFPEPAIPLHTAPRGTAAWELVGMLPGVLRDTAVVRDALGVDPTRPRPLYKAREGGVITSVEAAMIVSLYARQQKIDADWVLVRPAALGAAPGVSPEGFTTALVRVTVDGETRLLDPACETCAPFTVRDTLHGGVALGDGVDRIP